MTKADVTKALLNYLKRRKLRKLTKRKKTDANKKDKIIWQLSWQEGIKAKAKKGPSEFGRMTLFLLCILNKNKFIKFSRSPDR